MEDNENKEREFFACGCLSALILSGIGWMLLLLMLPGCSPRIVERVRVETRTVTKTQVDSFWRDRVRVVREKGDTVYIHDSTTVYKTQYRDRHDTLHVRDSIPVPVDRPVEVEVERPLTGWQRFRIGAFWWLLALVGWAYRKKIAEGIRKIIRP